MALAPSCPTRTQGTSSRFAIGPGQTRGTPKIRNLHELCATFVSPATFCLWTDLGCNILSPAFQIAHIHLRFCFLQDYKILKAEELSAQTNLGTLVSNRPARQTRLGRSSYACCVCRSPPKAPAATQFDRVPSPMVSALHCSTHVQI